MSDIELPELPSQLSHALTKYAAVYASGDLADEEREKVRQEIKKFARAAVEADRGGA